MGDAALALDRAARRFRPRQRELVEIPAESETNSNCVAYWRPTAGIVAGKDRPGPTASSGAGSRLRVRRISGLGIRGGRGGSAKRRRFVVAFSGDALADPQLLRDIKAALTRLAGGDRFGALLPLS